MFPMRPMFLIPPNSQIRPRPSIWSKPVGLGEFGDEVDVPEPAELTDDADLADKTEAIEKIELTDKTEAIEKIELADKTELTDKAELAGPVARNGLRHVVYGRIVGVPGQSVLRQPGVRWFSRRGRRLRPGETTEVIEPVRDEVPTAGEVPSGADVQAPAGSGSTRPTWLTDPAPADLRTPPMTASRTRTPRTPPVIRPRS